MKDLKYSARVIWTVWNCLFFGAWRHQDVKRQLK